MPETPVPAEDAVDTNESPTVDQTIVTTDDGRRVVDALGMPCPRPVIELANAVAASSIGDELLLLADDPAADVDVPVWCRMQRQQLVSQDRDGSHLRFVVRKVRESGGAR